MRPWSLSAVCDFCKAELGELHWELKVHPREVDPDEPVTVQMFQRMLNEPWEVCDSCAVFIGEKDWDGLLANAIQAYMGRHPEHWQYLDSLLEYLSVLFVYVEQNLQSLSRVKEA